MQAAKNITVIPATRMMHTGLPRNAAVRKRVAGYARVSTDSEEQQTSYEAQVDYYTNYIDREALIDDGRVLHTAFTDFNAIDKEVAEITSEIDVLSGLVQKLVDENASTTLDQTEYRSRYDGYIDRYDKAKKRLAALQEQRQLQELKGDILSGFLFELGELYDLPMVFKDETWNALVDHVTVHKGGRVVFTFKNGTEVTEML